MSQVKRRRVGPRPSDKPRRPAKVGRRHPWRAAAVANPAAPVRPEAVALPSGSWRAFTLIELLTVIAIIGVLATLLLTALAGAQKRSRLARCTANLHQIALALNMYLDDVGARPPDLPYLVVSKYLPAPGVLICPEDKTGNWAGLHEPQLIALYSPGGTAPTNGPASALGYSYLTPLWWDNDSWRRLLRSGASAGIAACELHGLPRPGAAAGAGFPTAIDDFEGLILRAQLDGAVVRRQWFWPGKGAAGSPLDSASALVPTQSGVAEAYPWGLFTDDPPP